MIRRALERKGPFGDLIRGDVLIPDGPPPRAAVLVVHGFKGFKDWGFFPHLRDRLACAGFATVAFNFSLNGIGDRPDELTELDAFGRNTLGRELDELCWMIEAVSDGDVLSFPPRALGLVGHSRGGALAILAAREEHRRVQALVTWAALARFDRWSEETRDEWRANGRVFVLDGRTGRHLPLDVTLLENFEANRDRLDVTAAAAAVRAPWLVLHGDDDLTVPRTEGECLVLASSHARLHRIARADHTFAVSHPFAGPTPQLRDATDATIHHLKAHLGRP